MRHHITKFRKINSAYKDFYFISITKDILLSQYNSHNTFIYFCFWNNVNKKFLSNIYKFYVYTNLLCTANKSI